VEIRVRNLGTEPGEGRVWVVILDETGALLLRLEPPEELKVIRVPASDMGGREGKVLRMAASRVLNNLIDRYDNERRRYDVRATVETLHVEDANPFDNSKTKSRNVPHAVRPGQRNTFNYVFQNHESSPVRVHWLFERTPYPEGWDIEGVPSSADPFTLQPDETVSGFLWMDAPTTIAEGAFVEARLSLVRADTDTIFGQHEWFQVHDTAPPTVTDYRLVLTETNQRAISRAAPPAQAGSFPGYGRAYRLVTAEDGNAAAIGMATGRVAERKPERRGAWRGLCAHCRTAMDWPLSARSGGQRDPAAQTLPWM
jgi:hypothetical protein